VKHAWIHAQRDSYPIEASCRALGVSRSGYYAWAGREPCARRRHRERIASRVQESHAASRGIYGHRKVHEDLVEEAQIACCRETVREVMGELGLRGKRRKRFVRTTDSNHDRPVASNVLAGDFTATGPNQKWVADITYIATLEGWLYLATVLDCFSRRVVGWSMSERIDANLVCEALEMAVEARRPPAGLIHHSDRGVQYTADSFRRLVARSGVALSMSRRASPWDNAMAESFFGSLKTEWIDGPYATRAEARGELFEYIEVFYNRQRRHASLGYVSPARYEELHEAGELTPGETAA
jgi:putative transposase